MPLQRPFQAVTRGRPAALTSRRQVAVLRSATEEEGEASHSGWFETTVRFFTVWLACCFCQV